MSRTSHNLVSIHGKRVGSRGCFCHQAKVRMKLRVIQNPGFILCWPLSPEQDAQGDPELEDAWLVCRHCHLGLASGNYALLAGLCCPHAFETNCKICTTI